MTGKRRATIILTSFSCGPLPAIIIVLSHPIYGMYNRIEIKKSPGIVTYMEPKM
jgi:hypothetical protein